MLQSLQSKDKAISLTSRLYNRIDLKERQRDTFFIESVKAGGASSPRRLRLTLAVTEECCLTRLSMSRAFLGCMAKSTMFCLYLLIVLHIPPSWGFNILWRCYCVQLWEFANKLVSSRSTGLESYLCGSSRSAKGQVKNYGAATNTLTFVGKYSSYIVYLPTTS